MANDKSSAVLATMQGSWSESLTYSLASNLKVELPLWQSNPMPEKHDWQYYFTNFTIKLNNLPEKMKKRLPRSDSRLRPDQRALENFDLELATTEKHRLEEKQRAARKWRAENPGNDFIAKYFKQITDPDTKEKYWSYGVEGTRDYWQDRRNRDFAHMEDLY